MEQKRLYRTIENIYKEAPKLKTNEEIMEYVLHELIKNEEINIRGGRIWKLADDKKKYILIEQAGDVEIIEDHYEVEVTDYNVFKDIGKYRSVVAEETDKYLIKKGIYHYSATGVGERYKIRPLKDDEDFYFLYQYLIALNPDRYDDDLINTLNIVSTTLSSILRSRRIETKALENIEDLEKAREIQRSILPEHEYKFGNYEIFGVSIPEKIVGGDFFDYLLSSDKDILGVAVGDAASKGISAAAQALYVSGALKMGVEFDIKMTTLIKKINQLIYDTFPYERFVTLFYLELFNDTKGLCLYINAGHNRPVSYKAISDEVIELYTTGPVLGPAPNQNFYYERFNFDVGDVMLIYSDGIVEAADKDFKFYTEERLMKVLKKYHALSPKEICEHIIEDVQTFSAHGAYSDDKTLVVIKRSK
ncbi:MAG TPA: PP2C family protein-serine/threonine phosphatase [Ignavibacteria bacterium]|nr:PP2C family protein-serine/threonine phosphatase [Ignavibacteria bacterium]